MEKGGLEMEGKGGGGGERIQVPGVHLDGKWRTGGTYKGESEEAAAVMGQVWGIGRRRFGKDWGKRVWLFDRLVWSVISYGVEIWGWKSMDRVEGLQDTFLRWVLGVQSCTPEYFVREELQREMLKGRAGMRAWEYVRMLEEGQEGEVARICWEEIKRRARRGGCWGDGKRRGRVFMRKGDGQ